MCASTACVRVAAGVILNSARDQVLLSWRLPRLHQGGLWEYPGGKIEPGESPESALARELVEELGIKVTEQSLLSVVSHDYGDKTVELHFYVVTHFEGVPIGQEGQPVQWCPVLELAERDFPAANQGVAKQLVAWLSASSE